MQIKKLLPTIWGNRIYEICLGIIFHTYYNTLVKYYANSMTKDYNFLFAFIKFSYDSEQHIA